MRRAAGDGLPPGSPLPRALQTLLLWRAPFAHLERCREAYGPSFTVRATSRPPLIFLSDPADVRTLLLAPADVLHPGEGANTIEPLVGELAFMLADGEQHLSGRRTVLPQFRARKVQDQLGLVASVASREIAAWPRGVPFALHPRLRELTLHTVLRVTCDAPGRLERQRLHELRGRLLEMLAVTASPVLPEPILRHGPGRRTWARFLRRRAAVDQLLYALITDRKRSGRRSGDLLDDLLSARNTDGSPLSMQQVRDDLMSIVLAGHETTASQLAWAFQLLAHNPSVQARLAEELDSGTDSRYLSATVSEVLRHRPVFLFAIPRAVKQPIPIRGRIYRPPAHLLACIYLLHHDPLLFPDPEEFRPERFLETPPPAAVWLPWGGGRKRCPGLHLATLELETVLRVVLATMTVRPAGKTIEPPRWRSVIVTPADGSRIVLHPRRSGKSMATRH